MSLPVILVTNDDGIHAPGLRVLIRIAREFGKVVVIAPDKPQSAMGHAVTVASPLRLKKISKEPDYEEYSCNGTPADAVKLGEKVILKRHPDLVLSGINHGSNAGINILYSGTMAAANEAAMVGIPGIGFSLESYDQDADFEPGVPYIRKIIAGVLKNGIKSYTCLNVNIPDAPASEINGIQVCRMGKGYWDEQLDERLDPGKKPYYWLAGSFVSLEVEEGTDAWALTNKYVSIVPITLDMTDHDQILGLKHLENHA